MGRPSLSQYAVDADTVRIPTAEARNIAWLRAGPGNAALTIPYPAARTTIAYTKKLRAAQ